MNYHFNIKMANFRGDIGYKSLLLRSGILEDVNVKKAQFSVKVLLKIIKYGILVH